MMSLQTCLRFPWSEELSHCLASETIVHVSHTRTNGLKQLFFEVHFCGCRCCRR